MLKMYMNSKGNLTKPWKNTYQRLVRYNVNSSDSWLFVQKLHDTGRILLFSCCFLLGSCYRHCLREIRPLVKARHIFGAAGGMVEALYVFPDWGIDEITAKVKTKCATSVFRRTAKLASQLNPKPPKNAELCGFVKSPSSSSLMNFIFQANFICLYFQW